MSLLHFVVPAGIDDPARPSGGNTYDRKLRLTLRRLGWSVHEHAAVGPWPEREPASSAALATAVSRIPDGALVLVDGLVASAAPEVLVPEARRVRLAVLVHMPLGHRSRNGAAGETRARERAVLTAASAVITTSAWSRRRLLELYELEEERIRVAEPGVDLGEPAPGTAAGSALLCVAAVSYEKGHDILIAALERVADLGWSCACVGSLEREPAFAAALRSRIAAAVPDDRVEFSGPRTGDELERTYLAADVLVLPSRAETYGMVVTEALGHGLPVIAADVGGVREALGHGADGLRPGLLLPSEDPEALAAALRSWLGDARLRSRLRAAALERRATLAPWTATAGAIAGALGEVGR